MGKIRLPGDLVTRMKELGIQEDKLEEKFVRSGGAGGQNVNKVSTCVQIYDPVRNLRVECQDERTQRLNRIGARVRLCDVVQTQADAEKARRKAARHKQRARNKKPSEKQQQKRLSNKKHRSDKKRNRKVGKDAYQ